MLENINTSQSLSSIIFDGNYDSDTAANALSLSKCIGFEFCPCLVTFTDLLKLCNVIPNILKMKIYTLLGQ